MSWKEIPTYTSYIYKRPPNNNDFMSLTWKQDE